MAATYRFDSININVFILIKAINTTRDKNIFFHSANKKKHFKILIFQIYLRM